MDNKNCVNDLELGFNYLRLKWVETEVDLELECHRIGWYQRQKMEWLIGVESLQNKKQSTKANYMRIIGGGGGIKKKGER